MPTRVVILVVFSGSSSARGTVAGNFRAVFSVRTYLRASFRIGKEYAKSFPLYKERFPPAKPWTHECWGRFESLPFHPLISLIIKWLTIRSQQLLPDLHPEFVS